MNFSIERSQGVVSTVSKSQVHCLLITDDDASEIRLFSEILSPEGYRLSVAFNGNDGFGFAVQRLPQLILLNVNHWLPELNGHAVVRMLGCDSRLSGIPIVMLNTSSALPDKLAAFNEGVVDYITKPFAREELVARLRVHLRGFATATAAAHTAIPLVGAETTPAAGVQTVNPALRQGSQWVAKAQALLLQRLGNSLSLTELAHELGTNERRLTEEFRRHTGKTVFEYVRTQRHSKACDLLLKTTTPIHIIADTVGFGTAAAFTYAFRQRCGLTPRQFRASGGLVAEATAPTVSPCPSTASIRK